MWAFYRYKELCNFFKISTPISFYWSPHFTNFPKKSTPHFISNTSLYAKWIAFFAPERFLWLKACQKLITHNENGTSHGWPTSLRCPSVRGALISDLDRWPSPPPPPAPLQLIATPSFYGYSVKIPPPHVPSTIKHNRVILNKTNERYYLTWIKFRVDKISRFSRFLIKTAKLNPREIH